MKESAKSLQERVAELTRQLEDGVKAVFSSDRYAEYHVQILSSRQEETDPHALALLMGLCTPKGGVE